MMLLTPLLPLAMLFTPRRWCTGTCQPLPITGQRKDYHPRSGYQSRRPSAGEQPAGAVQIGCSGGRLVQQQHRPAAPEQVHAQRLWVPAPRVPDALVRLYHAGQLHMTPELFKLWGEPACCLSTGTDGLCPLHYVTGT